MAIRLVLSDRITYRNLFVCIATYNLSDDFFCIQDSGISIADIPYHVKIEGDEEQFSSDKSKIFLPITYVTPDTSRSNVTQSGDADNCSHSEYVHMPTKTGGVSNPFDLTVGSAVQYLLKSEQYGVIKWIGTLSGSKETFAGVEMVRH